MKRLWNWTRNAVIALGMVLLFAATSSAQMDWVKHTIWTGLNEPEAVQAADIDYDGDIDFLGTLRGPDSVVLFINDGQMNWSLNYVTQSLDGAIDVEVIDLNLDGNLDIIASGVYEDVLAWYENDGDLNWTEHILFQGYNDLRVHDIRDYDYDGDLDVIAPVYQDNLILILENDGLCTFTPIENIGCGNHVPFAYWTDLNNDAYYDIVYNLPDNDEHWFVENQDNAIYAPHMLSDSYDGAWGIYSDDVDSDGDQDIVGVYAYNNGGVVLWENQGNYQFFEQVIVDDTSCDRVTTADLDHDGNVDIIPYAYTYQPVDLSWLENTGAGWTHHILEYSWSLIREIHPFDMDCDGDLDFLVAEELGDRFTWLENLIVHDLNPPCFSQNIISAATNATHRLNWGDLDRDGDYDILAAGADGLMWWEQNLLLFTEHPVDVNFLNATSVQSCDLDRDGDFDLVATSDLGRVSWLEQTGPGSFLAHDLDIAFPNAEYALIEDFNKDGKLDVAAAGAEGVCVYFNDGQMNFSDTPIPGGFILGTGLATADIDRDGDQDIVASGGPNSIVWFDNHRDGTFTEDPVSSSFANARSVQVVDLDRDGDFDILGAGDPGIYWWEKDGGGFIEHVLDGSFVNATSVATEDILWDGIPDVVASGGDQIAYWVNNGDGTFSRHDVEQNFTGARCVLPVDLNRNGTIDFIGSSAELNTVTFWLAEGTLTISIEPFAHPVVIPPWGGHFDFKARIVNRGGQPAWFTGWTEAQLPNGTVVGPLLLIPSAGIAPYSGYLTIWTQNVPGFAPAGEYIYTAHIGGYPEATLSSDALQFTKAEGMFVDNNPVNDWNLSGGGLSSEEAENAVLPTEYGVDAAWPNPFNPSTTLSVSLPETAELSVIVYNLSGQRVATLASGQHTAGTHSLTFDGSSLASGVYFVHAVVPGWLDQMQKVVLVK